MLALLLYALVAAPLGAVAMVVDDWLFQKTTAGFLWFWLFAGVALVGLRLFTKLVR